MKPNQLLLFLALTIGLTQPLSSQSYRLIAADFSITGTSNVHDWESQVTQVNWRGDLELSEAGLDNISNVHIRIPVESIESSKGRIMDKKTYAALEAETHPNITYTLTSCDIRQNGDHYLASTKGQLTIAGTAKTVAIAVRMEKAADGNFLAQGDYTLKMTDYGIEPPTALLGTLTTGDEVGLHFSLTLSPQ